MIASGLTYTILRPSYFMETWLPGTPAMVDRDGRIRVYGRGDQLVSLVAVVGVIATTFQRTTRAEGSSRAAPAGAGDLRLFESRQVLPNTGGGGALAQEQPAETGTGELRVYEAQQAAAPTAGQKPYTVENEGISFKDHNASLPQSADCAGSEEK